MSASTGIVIATGGVSFLNEWIGNSQPPDFAILLATGVAAGGFYLLEKVNVELSVGIAWIAFVTSLLVQPKSGNSVVTNLLEWEASGNKPASKKVVKR